LLEIELRQPTRLCVDAALQHVEAVSMKQGEDQAGVDGVFHEALANASDQDASTG
jgi:hypothetical protein